MRIACRMAWSRAGRKAWSAWALPWQNGAKHERNRHLFELRRKLPRSNAVLRKMSWRRTADDPVLRHAWQSRPGSEGPDHARPSYEGFIRALDGLRHTAWNAVPARQQFLGERPL